MNADSAIVIAHAQDVLHAISGKKASEELEVLLHLPCVIKKSWGEIPLMLILLYIFVGGRAGILIDGVNLLGHFIARCSEIYFDPFHESCILFVVDCADILAQQKIELTDEYLEKPEPHQILARLLANFSHAYHIEEAAWQKGMVDRWFAIVTGTTE